MNKKKIVDQLISNVNSEISKAKEAFGTTKAHASENEMKAEGKYDTRSVEAGYLAGAQGKRVEELKLELQMLQEINIKDFEKSDEIAIGALAKIKFNDQERLYFISPTAGGTMLEVDDQPILVISVFSPIGSCALGLGIGETFEVETPKDKREYEIMDLF